MFVRSDSPLIGGLPVNWCCAAGSLPSDPPRTAPRIAGKEVSGRRTGLIRVSTSPIAGSPADLPRTMVVVRALLPSLGDLLLLAIVFWLFCAQPDSWSHFMGDANTGLHIRTGDYILSHGGVPHRDLYSWSRPQGAWFSVEWLSCVVYSALHRVWGLRA